MIITRSGFFKRGYNLAPASGGFSPPDIVSSNFDSGLFSPFAFSGGSFTSGTIISDPTGAYNKIYENSYTNIGPASDRNSGAAYITSGTEGPLPGEDLFFRGYLYFPSASISRWTASGTLLRKLTYCRDDVNGGTGQCDFVVGMHDNQLFIYYTPPSDIAVNNLVTITQDTWHLLEWRIRRSSTVNANDGQWQLWWNSVEVLNQSGKAFNPKANGVRWAWLNVGAQREGCSADTGSDFDTRYWANIAFSRNRIGP